MSRETETFRDCLVWLDENAPNKCIFNKIEVERITGKSRAFINKTFAFSDGCISKINLARALSKIGGLK